MKRIQIIILIGFLSSCAVKTPVENTYKLEAFGTKAAQGKHHPVSILVSSPIAVAGYNTEQMLYIIKPFELSPFVKNAWVGAPANMLYPLIIQSLQASDYFYAVISLPYSNDTDYRLDTQLLALEQNFLVKPSRLDLVVKNVLIDTKNNRIISSRIFGQHLPCPIESPYGGVLAANNAAKLYTTELTDFVINAINHDRN